MNKFVIFTLAAMICYNSTAYANLSSPLRSQDQIVKRVQGLTEAFKLRGQSQEAAVNAAVEIVNRELPESGKVHVVKRTASMDILITGISCTTSIGVIVLAVGQACINKLDAIGKNQQVLIQQNNLMLKSKGIDPVVTNIHGDVIR